MKMKVCRCSVLRGRIPCCLIGCQNNNKQENYERLSFAKCGLKQVNLCKCGNPCFSQKLSDMQQGFLLTLKSLGFMPFPLVTLVTDTEAV